MEILLNVKNLTINFSSGEEVKPLVKNINFKINKGETLVLLGESGSGKTLTALSIMQLLPEQAKPSVDSQILFDNQNLLSLPLYKIRKLRGGDIAMIFQEPATSLNPVLSIKDQIAESLRLHQGLRTRAKIKEKTLKLLNDVKIQDADRVYNAYPHQISGGMKQRVMIAMALAGKPKLLIADEPTTALDVTIQAEILKLLKDLKEQYGLSLLYITHDLRVGAQIADTIAIMYQGQIIEMNKASNIIQNPQQSYTKRLFSAYHKLVKSDKVENSETVLRILNLKVYFPINHGLFKKNAGFVKAVDNVTLLLKEGQTLALIGESGSGKSTLAKAIMSLILPTEGEIFVLGEKITGLSNRQLREKRKEYQMIFQDPFSAMNPRMLIKDILEEGMQAFDIGTDNEERLDRMDVVLTQVGLLPKHKYRYPHEFSGGQRQRICIARALLVGPRILVCDEPTSSLDVSVQAEIIDLLISLQQEFELSYLFITHNFSVVKALAHEVAVMHKGKIVEQGSVENILNMPQNLYTQSLIKSSLDIVF